MVKHPQPIHRVLAPALGRLGALTLCLGCSSSPSPPSSVVGTPVLEAIPDAVEVGPGQSRVLHFFLHTEAGAAIPLQPVTFAIIDNPATPGNDANGATLSSDSALSDPTGSVTTQVTAGLVGVFQVRATSGTAEADVAVVVAKGAVGAVDVSPFFPPGSAAAPGAATIDVIFYDDSACEQLSLFQPPAAARDTVSLDVADGMAIGVAPFASVATASGNAIIGLGRDGNGAVTASGCVDLPGTTLVAGGVVQVALPLRDADPDPAGQFAVTSDFQFSPPLPMAAAIAAPWLDLQDCPLDPAQLWLDCTIDALSGPQPGDPTDCRPAASEGALGDALSALRGAFLAGAADAGLDACRPSRDGSGAPSLDAQVMGLFGSPTPPLLLALGPIAADAARLLNTLRLESQLTITSTATPGVYLADHRFQIAELTLGTTPYDVALEPLGLPVLDVPFVSAVEQGTSLAIGPHGITLRLGTVARSAFGQLALAARGLPPSSIDFTNAIAALATAPAGSGGVVDAGAGGEPDAGGDGGVPSSSTGCAALDALLCGRIARAPGCLGTACSDGLAALAARLDAGFAQSNGAAIDFTLAGGSAVLIDSHGAGPADRLGDRTSDPPQPGLWQAELSTSTGKTAFTGVWDAVRTAD